MTTPAAAENQAAPQSRLRVIVRILGLLHPHRYVVYSVMIAALLGVVSSSIAPLVLGRGTDIIFNGVVGMQLPAGCRRTPRSCSYAQRVAISSPTWSPV